MSTSSRSPITAAGPRRPTRSSRPSGPGSRSPRPEPATRTAIRPKRTLERLAASGARVFRTDVDGTVTVTFERDDGIARCRGRGRRPIAARDATSPAARAAGRRSDARSRARRPLRPRPRSRHRLGRRTAPPADRRSGGRTDPATRSMVASGAVGYQSSRRMPSRPRCRPRRVGCRRPLLSLDPPTLVRAHARAVAEVAGLLAARIEARGIAVDRPARRGRGAAPRRRQAAARRRPGARASATATARRPG